MRLYESILLNIDLSQKNWEVTKLWKKWDSGYPWQTGFEDFLAKVTANKKNKKSLFQACALRTVEMPSK